MNLPLLANIDVDDLESAETFYVAALGLRPHLRFGHDGVEFVGVLSSIFLRRKAAGSAAGDATAQTRDYRRHWTPVHLDFVVDDLDAALARALEAGARLEGQRDDSWGRIATLADPFGHGFCLIQFQNRGYDEIATRA